MHPIGATPDDSGVGEGTASALLARAESWLTAARASVRHGRVEIFHRAAARRRVERSGDDPPGFSAGWEEGVALRLGDVAGGREGFAAAACGPAGVPIAWLIGRAGETAGPVSAPWREDAARLVDREIDAALPTEPQLEDWLAMAVSALGSVRDSGGRGAFLPEAWVETAFTVESLVQDGGLVASRSRLRVWASATFRDRSLPDAPERPHVVAARRLEGLDPHGWAVQFDQAPDRARVPALGSDRPVALEPEAAAVLVAALVPILHGSGACAGAKVGPGWSLADDPLHPEALVGGSFDDAGFEAQRTILASGGVARGGLVGPGCLRRASYRDRPEPRSSQLVVSGHETVVPDDAWRVRSIRVHPQGAGPWVLELEGDDGETGGIVRGARLIARPEQIAEACTASFGSPRRGGWGVITPGLILEGLRVEG